MGRPWRPGPAARDWTGTSRPSGFPRSTGHWVPNPPCCWSESLQEWRRLAEQGCLGMGGGGGWHDAGLCCCLQPPGAYRPLTNYPLPFPSTPSLRRRWPPSAPHPLDAHRPLTPSCPPPPPAWPTLTSPTPPSVPSGGGAGLSLCHCPVSGPHGGGHRPSPLARGRPSGHPHSGSRAVALGGWGVREGGAANQP